MEPTDKIADQAQPAEQTVQAQLWCVNILGPDDVLAMTDRVRALEEANTLNLHFAKLDEKRHQYDPIMRAVVVEWPGSAQAHAAALERSGPTPPPDETTTQRTPLTDSEITALLEASDWPAAMLSGFVSKKLRVFARAIERAHGIRTPKEQTMEHHDLPGFVKPDNENQVFFYEQDFYVLSNFSAFSVEWKGNRFPTSEHAYHWEKFKEGNGYCRQIAENIHFAKSAHDAFKLAEACKEHRRIDWDDVKVPIMRGILRAKVEQHEYVRRKLLASGDRELIEDSWRDDFWGWGPNRDGQNMLGNLWMEVRAELREAE